MGKENVIGKQEKGGLSVDDCQFHQKASCLNMHLSNCRQSSGISGRDRIVVSTSRCGRDNPGSNPGHGMPALLPYYFDFASNTHT